ncbi:hypothetical protein ABIC03_007788 [Bradyrhizobium sp. RT6a]
MRQSGGLRRMRTVRLASECVEEEGHPHATTMASGASPWIGRRYLTANRAGAPMPLQAPRRPKRSPGPSAHCRTAVAAVVCGVRDASQRPVMQRMLRPSPSKTWSPYGLGECADGNAESSARMPDKAAPAKHGELAANRAPWRRREPPPPRCAASIEGVLFYDQLSRERCQVLPASFSHNERLSNGDPVVAEP